MVWLSGAAVKWIFWIFFYFYNLFSQSATSPVYLFVSLFVNLQFVSYYFTALNIFQDFSLNFARTLGHAVDKLLNGSRVNSHGQFIFGKATRLSNKTERVIFHIF